MHKFVRSLITEWRKLQLPTGDASIVIAVSGGADSMSLLAAISDLTKRKKLGVRVIVAHFNHHLRGVESDDDETFVGRMAESYGFELEIGTGKLSRKGNLEQNARDARYRFLTDVAKQHGAGVVLTGHTLNDQAETLLINLIRGSGPEGLAGMHRIRDLAEGVLLARPLLGWARREDTEGYCRENDIRFRTDRMNDDTAFTRVRIRKAILPALAELNPRIIETLARTADLLGNNAGDHASNSHEAASDDPPAGLRLAEVKSLSKPELYAELRKWLRRTRGDLRSIQLKHIEAIERLIHSRKSGKTAELPGRGAVVKEGGSLVFKNIKVEK
jgi:tRNA(Ile)-lysidine synthase